MGIEGALSLSLGFNFIQLALWFRERRLRLNEKEKFALYIKSVDKRFAKLEKKSNNP